MLATLLGLLCGPALAIAGAITLGLPPAASARALEQRAWRRLWLPLGPAGLIAAFLIGWAIQEPRRAEAAAPALPALAALFGLIALRAAARAVRALRRPPRDAAAATRGLWRPRVHIAPALSARLDEHALRAVLAHEEAHARHRDPLRLWLAQIATDLQWPSAAARRRFADWRAALELARDAEACERVDGSDLAAGLIEAARLHCDRAASGEAAVGLMAPRGPREAFSERVHRLLEPRPEAAAPAGPGRRWMWVLVAAVALAIGAGSLVGEEIVGSLPGVVE
jgi:hypothetical protein